MTLVPGARIGSYEVLALLGTGGMGEVYRARDARLERDVAIKILPDSLAGDPDRLIRFEREARTLASLNHPHIAQIFALDDRALVMELVDGEDLARRLARGPIPLDEALRIARQITEALEAAHDKGIIHRDLKPANIKVRPDGAVKILDFGLAKALETPHAAAPAESAKIAPTIAPAAATGAGVVLGTPGYMSPEQARGHAVDSRTDIWAFGCVLYEMLAGQSPFAGETLVDTLSAVVGREPDWRLLPDATPSAIVRLLQRCLEKSVAARIRDIADARLDIEDATTVSDVRRSTHRRDSGERRHNLPAELTSFVGRTEERTELARRLTSSRLLSLVGAGGAGKTRLALRLASDLAAEYRDGVWLVDLAPVTMPNLVPQTIASAIGVCEAPQRSIREMLLETVRHRELLLVLDNCEHLVDTCAEIADELLRAAPAMRIVATSREPLRVPGEAVWRVSSLSLPDVGSSASTATLLAFEATRLFIDRATLVDPAFAATDDNAPLIARICHRLDGIPLAIELAAARVEALSIDQIDARLQDRFRLLTGGARTAVARQRTLEATMQWSYQLLSAQERLLLARLSVFPAGWSLDAAEQICSGDGIDTAEVVDLLSRLVVRSLVVLDGQRDRRYRLLETVRQYARERLIESGNPDALRDRHFAFVFGEFHAARPALQGSAQVRWLKRIHVEQDNVRAALEWSITSPMLAPKALALAGALFWYWTKRGVFTEGRQWLERSLTVNRDVRGSVRAVALIGLAHMLYFKGHLIEADHANAEALAAARDVDDRWATAFALFGHALAAFEQGRTEVAAARASEAVAVGKANGDDAGPLLVLGNCAMLQGDLDRAQALYDESNEVNRRAGEIWGLGIGLLVAAGQRVARGDFAAACAHASESLTFNLELEDPRGIAWCLETIAGLLAATDHADAAARLWAAADRALENAGLSNPPFIKWIRDRYLDGARRSLGSAAFEAASAEGRGMSVSTAIDFAHDRIMSM